MNVNVVLNYYFTGRQQMALLKACHDRFQRAKSVRNVDGTKSVPSFRGSRIVLGIFLLHYINYELNQYTYVILYDEKWPELTFYVVFYFIEMITVMHALYYDSVLDMIRLCARLDCAQLAVRLEQDVKRDCSGKFDDSYWWRTIEHFYSRLLELHGRGREYCRTFRLQLVSIALNTFVVSFSIFYVNLNSIIAYDHDNWLEKYKRVTECLGFFSQLGALLLICRHATELEGEQLSLMRLILRAQSKLTKSTSNRKRGNVFCSRILILQNGMKIAPFDLFDFDMEYFFGMIAAIVTYLVVLFQFRALE
uniref:Gustatory receptor n=1 Tax=Anopheles stephensi TaxID=30069 RepID=A0A182Y7Z7_ANOST